MDDELRQQLARIEAKTDAAFRAAEKTRKYILWSMILGLVVVVGPLLLLPFVIPQFLSTYSTLGGL